MRTVVLGGFGNFGARICRALGQDPGIELIPASRHPPREDSGVRLDLHEPGFARALRALRPDLVIHCAGPFQGQDYRVVQATLEAGAHYVDLADGRSFVVGFPAANDARARAAGRFATSGASTLPALSTAVIDHFQSRFRSIDEIHIVIAPGQKAPRGEATIAGVLSYAGRTFRWWSGGEWRDVRGWQELRHVRLAFGHRLAAACDVPDLELLPTRYAGVRTVEFRAALELAVQHHALWTVAALRRVGMPLPVERWAGPLNRAVGLLDAFGSDRGGMLVSLGGIGSAGRSLRVEWHLTAGANHGPEIPCMPAILLARRLAARETFTPGAFACMGLLRLSEFEPEFERWGMEQHSEIHAT